MRKHRHDDTGRAARRLRRNRAAAAMVLAGSLGGTMVVGQQPATATCEFPANIAISDAAVVEGTGGGLVPYTAMTFTVTWSNAPTSVNWATGDGTGTPIQIAGSAATSASDYVKASGTLQLTGTSPKKITVFVFRDYVDEPTQYLHVRLSNPQGACANIFDGLGVGRIYDDD